MATNIAKELQKISSNAQIQIQKLANQSTEKSFQYNAQEANSARTWQKMMSDTSHQREVADLKKAGLNPVLSSNQGAQSYTTSSASAQAVDPTSAYANITGSQISGRATGYAADTSARATRAAAAQAARAQKYAAQMNYAASLEAAAAQRYAADRHLDATKYSSDKSYEAKKYSTDYNKHGNIIGVLTSALSNNINGSKKLINSSVASADAFNRNRDTYMKPLFQSKERVTFASLNFAGRRFVNNQLSKWNVPKSNKAYSLYIDTFINGSKSAAKSWNNLVISENQKMNRAIKAAKNITSTRMFYGYNSFMR